MAFSITVVSTITRSNAAGLMALISTADTNSELQQLLKTVLAEDASEAADLRGVARQAWLVAVHAAEELPRHVLGPARDEIFVAEIERILQVRQADHQAHGQARAARRALAACELAFKAAGQVLTAELLGRPRVARQLRRHRRFERGPRQAL